MISGQPIQGFFMAHAIKKRWPGLQMQPTYKYIFFFWFCAFHKIC